MQRLELEETAFPLMLTLAGPCQDLSDPQQVLGDAFWLRIALPPKGFLNGRPKFGGHENSAPFASVVVVFKPLPESRSQVTRMERAAL